MDNLNLKSKVRIRAAKDITGVVVAITSYRDGSTRFAVQYWHGGDRCTTECEAEDLEVIDE